jgi:hypothetical protein
LVDTIAILISHVLILYTVFRAVKLDRELPWFESEPSEVGPNISIKLHPKGPQQ